jgi:hypothetical protein
MSDRQTDGRNDENGRRRRARKSVSWRQAVLSQRDAAVGRLFTGRWPRDRRAHARARTMRCSTNTQRGESFAGRYAIPHPLDVVFVRWGKLICMREANERADE